jgi:hypothetical protein
MTANTQVKVWFDGAHAASVEEIELLKAKNNPSLQFIGVSQDGFQPEGEVAADAVRGNVVVKDASGAVLKGVDALEAVYNILGLGSYFRYTRKPGLESGRKFEPLIPELKKAA